MMRLVIAGLVLLAAACTSQPQTYRDLERIANDQQREAISRPAPDTCHMADHRNLIGREGASIDRGTLPTNARVICHNCPVTLDYSADRLNVQLGADGKVASLRCG
ncbi:MAG TPA: I78 family peptidase inhibitor [Verrucomicrobiae bacterium]|nr:I78 family peptidase inhibitor [Verrucomicrobiae bacterium]